MEKKIIYRDSTAGAYLAEKLCDGGEYYVARGKEIISMPSKQWGGEEKTFSPHALMTAGVNPALLAAYIDRDEVEEKQRAIAAQIASLREEAKKLDPAWKTAQDQVEFYRLKVPGWHFVRENVGKGIAESSDGMRAAGTVDHFETVLANDTGSTITCQMYFAMKRDGKLPWK